MHNYTLIALVWLALSICFFFFTVHLSSQLTATTWLAGRLQPQSRHFGPRGCPKTKMRTKIAAKVRACLSLVVPDFGFLSPVCVCVFVFILSWASPIFLFLVRFSFAFGPKAAAAAPTICINVGQVELTTLNLTETGMTWCRASFSWFLFLFYFFLFLLALFMCALLLLFSDFAYLCFVCFCKPKIQHVRFLSACVCARLRRQTEIRWKWKRNKYHRKFVFLDFFFCVVTLDWTIVF